MSLAQKVTSGAAWTIAAGLVSRFVGLLGTLIITRFLVPEVMGEVTAATVLAFTASWLTQLGFNQYIMVRGGEGREPVFHATILSLGCALLALSLMALLAPHLTQFFNAPHLGLYLPGMALAVFIRRIGSTPDKLLLRQMRFRTIAIATAAGEVTYSALAVTLVINTDLGGFAIVIANIVQAAVVTGTTSAACGLSEWLTPVRLKWSRVREIFRYGLPLGAETALYESARYGDKILFAKLFGPAATGEYGLAYNLADLPATYVGEQVSNVLLPTLMQVEPERRQGVLIRAIGLLALVTFPMAVGLAAIAHTLVDVLLPDRWQGVAPFLVVLAAVSVFRPVNGLISQYLVSIERNNALLGAEVVRVVVLFVGIALLAQFGALIAALAIGLAAFVHTCSLLYSVHGDGSLLRGLLAALRTPIVASLSMVSFVLALRYAIGPVDGIAEMLLLGGEIAGGAGGYALAMFAVGRRESREVIALARGVIQARAA
jgi:O-antigen/teichoic acid export membrane protein